MDPDFERMVAQAQVRPQNRGDVGVPDKQVFLLAAEYLPNVVCIIAVKSSIYLLLLFSK